MADCGTPGSPGTSAELLVGRIRVQESLGLLPAHWWVKLGPGASAGQLAGRAGSWGLVAGLSDLMSDH